MLAELGGRAIDERWFVLGAAFLLHAIIYSEAFLRHLPAFLRVDKMLHVQVARYEARMNKQGRSAGKLRMRGSVLSFYVLIISCFSGVALGAMTQQVHYGWVLEMLLLVAMLRWRPMDDLAEQHVQETADSVQHLQHYSPYSTEHMDRHARFRHVVELMGLAFAERMIGCALAYMIGGVPLLWVHGACCVLYMHVGQKSTKDEPFGMGARSLYWFMQAVPSMIAALLLRAGRMFAPKLEGAPPKHMAGEAYGWHRWMLASLLGIQLGGKQRIGSRLCDLPWVGAGTAKVRRHHVRQAQRLVRAAALLWCLCLFVAAAYSYS